MAASDRPDQRQAAEMVTPFSQLPIEWLEQILHFVSTADLFRSCVAVNSEWNFATRYVLRTRETLTLGPDRRATDDLDVILVNNVVNGQQVLASLLTMTSVKVLIIRYSYRLHWLSHQLIAGMAGSLERLDCITLPDGELLYPRLQHLKCSSLPSQQKNVMFPRLQSLDCEMAVSGFTVATAGVDDALHSGGG